MKISIYTKRALLVGAISLMVIATDTFLLGHLTGYEAKVLINNSINGLNTLRNTIALASATILVLLLTLLSLSSSSSSKLKEEYHKHVLRIAKVDTTVFIASAMAFLLLNLPITESDAVPGNWFSTIYYISLDISSVLNAALIVVVLMLYNTVASIIRIVGLGIKDYPLAI